MVQAIKRDEVFIEPEGIHVETHQPERRSRKPPLLLVHGALTGSWLWTEIAAYLAERGWEAHAVNLRGHFTSDVAAGKRLAYTRDEAEARQRVASGEAKAAILVRPTRLDQLADVATAGDVMPQKSTYFYPKLLTGMVFNPLED